MWLKKGAELGNGACVAELITAYTHGRYGLAPDQGEAFRWIRIGWEMDFKERGYSPERRAQELARLLNNYRSHYRVRLAQEGKTPEEIRQALAFIQ